MKKLLLIGLFLGFAVSLFSQHRATVAKEIRDIAIKKVPPTEETMNLSHESLPATKAYWPPEETVIGNTFYDLQSNASMQNRIFVHDDGTIGAIWTFGIEHPNFSNDRGTGYNYFDGDEWGEHPTERVEDDRTGWPAYAPWGENGEIIVSHYWSASTTGLALSRRNTKGSGDWTQLDFHSPNLSADYAWARMATGGVNHSVVHLIAVTLPTPNAGVVYQGLDGAILYSRSEDGGDTWSIENELFEELNSDNNFGFSGDTYDIQTQGENNVAILYGESWTDFGLLKSTDGGDTWEHTIIWPNPYPAYPATSDPPSYTTDGFYCPDGAHSLAFDQSGKVHVVFGINWSQALAEPVGTQAAGYYWRAGAGGIGYWNEDRPTFSADTNALNPYGEVGSELVDNYSLIGWSQDLNGNDTIDIAEDIAPYYLGFSSMPQVLIDDNNHMYVVYSSVTESYENAAGLYNYRHIWARGSLDLGETWDTTFTDLTKESIHIIDECVFPSIASYSDDKIYLVYQTDFEPGMAVRPTTPQTHTFIETFIRFMEVDKVDILPTVGIEENNIPIFDYDVMQNYPNPFTGSSTVEVNVRHSVALSLEVVNLMGQVVYTVDAGVAQPGMNTLTIDGTKLTSGVYFYTVRAGETAITKKMIVE